MSVERNRQSFYRLQSRFTALNKNVGRNFLRKISRQGAAIARKEAQRIAPFQDRTGAGRKGIIIAERRATPDTPTYVVAFSKKRGFGFARSGFYIKFLEGGVQPHPIGRGLYLVRGGPLKGTVKLRQKRGTVASFANSGELKIVLPGGKVIFRKIIHHPGIKARPFLKQALDNTKGAILDNATRLLNDVGRQIAVGRGA